MSDSVFADLYSNLGKVSINSQNKNLKLDGDVFGDNLLFSISGKNFLYKFNDSTKELKKLKEFNATPELIRKVPENVFYDVGAFVVNSDNECKFMALGEDLNIYTVEINSFQPDKKTIIKNWNYSIPYRTTLKERNNKILDTSVIKNKYIPEILYISLNVDGTYSLREDNSELARYNEKPGKLIDGAIYSLGRKLMHKEKLLKEFSNTPHFLKLTEDIVYFFVDNDSGTKFCKYNIGYNVETPFKMLKSFNMTAESTPAEMGGKLYYVMSTQSGFELWQTNIADDTSSLVAELSSNTAISSIGTIKTAGDVIYFSVTDKTDCNTLWKSDGTTEGTSAIAGAALASPYSFNVINNHSVYVGSVHGELPAICYTDGETVKSLSSLNYTLENINASSFIEWNKKIIFNVSSPSEKDGIWISDFKDQSEMIQGTEGMNFNKVVYFDDCFYFFTDSACYYSDGKKAEKLFDGTGFNVVKKNDWMKVKANQSGDKVVYLCKKGKAHKMPHSFSDFFVYIDNEQFVTSSEDSIGILTLDNKFTPFEYNGLTLKKNYYNILQRFDNLVFFTANNTLFAYKIKEKELVDLNNEFHRGDSEYAFWEINDFIKLNDFFVVLISNTLYKLTTDLKVKEIAEIERRSTTSKPRIDFPQVANGILYFFDGDVNNSDIIYYTDGTPEGFGIIAKGRRYKGTGPNEFFVFKDRLVMRKDSCYFQGSYSIFSTLMFNEPNKLYDNKPTGITSKGYTNVYKFGDGLLFAYYYTSLNNTTKDDICKTDGSEKGVVKINIPQSLFGQYIDSVYEKDDTYSHIITQANRVTLTRFCYQTDNMAVPVGYIPSFISKISPSCGLTSGGNIVTINGNYLGNGSDITEVTFNGEKAEIIEQSEISIKVKVPSVSEDGWAAVKIVSESCGITVSGLKYKFTNNSADITVDVAEIDENGGIAVVTATLQTPSEKDTEIGFSITGSADQNQDYELSDSNIVIPAGDTTGSITVTAIADDLYDESDELIELTPIHISGAIPAYDTLLSITIKNDLPIYTVTYSADEDAGYIIGQKEQSIAYCEDTLPVFAVANPGYIFTGWSDSKTSNPRVDSNVISDLNIEAIFEKVAPKLFNILGKIIGDKITSVTVSAVSVLTGETVTTTVSDEAGSFVFENLSSGVYEISVVIPDGYTGTPDVIRVYTDKLDSGNNIIFKITKTQPDIVKLVIPKNDEYSLLAGNTLTVPTPGVLENDEIPEGISVEILVTKKPLHGALTFKEDGSFEYKPKALYFGIDKFVYALKSKNGTLSNSAEVTIKIAPEMISVGSLISLKDFATSQDDAKAMRMKVYGAVDNRNYRLRINTKGDNGVNAVWVKRLRLINFRPGKSNIDNLKLATQAKSVEITLKTKDNKKLISKALFVPPQIEKISVTGSQLSLVGSYFGPKAPKVYLVSKSDKTFIKCKVSKNDYVFNALTGKSLLKAEIPSNRVTAGKYSIVLFNKVGIGVTEENILPVVDIK
jgi:ELWxxDGT repeat protein